MARYALLNQDSAIRERALEEFFEAALGVASGHEFASTKRAGLGPLELEISTDATFQQRDWSAPLTLRPGAGGCIQARVLAWGGSLEGRPFPAPPWGNNYVYTHRGDIRGYASPRISVAFNYECRLLSLWDKESKTAIYWTPDPACLKFYEWSAPLRTILHWIGVENGLALTHAAAVGKNGRGLLLCGKGGSGKSTTSLACWHAGWQFVSDDYCWISFDGVPRAYSIYSTAKLLPDQPVDLPDWSRVEGLSDDKDVFNLAGDQTGSLVESLELVGLMLPHVSEVERARLRSASPRDGLAGLSLSTVAQLAGAGVPTMNILKRVAEALPNYHLDLCHPVSRIPALLEEALS